MHSYQYCINPCLCSINSDKVCYYHHVVFVAALFFLQSNQPDFFFYKAPTIDTKRWGGRKTQSISEHWARTTGSSFLCQNLPSFQQNLKLNKFSLRGQLLRPPYLVPTMCGGLHAKFQDSRINNKKGPPPFHCLGQIMEYNSVWSAFHWGSFLILPR